MKLENLKESSWHITFVEILLVYDSRASNALTGEGINDGIEWIIEKIGVRLKQKKK